MHKFEEGQQVWVVLYTDESMPYTELVCITIEKSITYNGANFNFLNMGDYHSSIDAIFPTKNEAIDHIIKKWDSLKDNKEDLHKKFELPRDDYKKMCDAAGFHAMASIGGL